MLRCDINGYRLETGHFIHGDECQETATHRYRTSEEEWGHRCARHARLLDRRHVTVEEIDGES